MADEILDALTASAQKPQRVKTDAGEVEAHSLADQIAADKYTRAITTSRTTAGRSAWGCLRGAQYVPPGTV